MPYVNKPRPYKKEYEQYDGTPAVKKRRAQRNKARRMLEKEGKVHKGDGKDVNHIKPLTKGGKTTLGNLNVETAHDNRSFTRNSDRSVKINRPKKKK
jgi:hypothetical protein